MNLAVTPASAERRVRTDVERETYDLLGRATTFLSRVR
jgi:hypothetical protein